MKKRDIFKALQKQLDTQSDEKAGYPPNCNRGYVEKDGKCVPVSEIENSKTEKRKKKSDK